MKYELVLTGKFKKGLKLLKREGLIFHYWTLLLINCFKEYRWRKSIRIIH